MIATMRTYVFDCPDPAHLGAFYAAILGGELKTDDDPTWCIVLYDDARRLGFQRSGDYRPPTYPDVHGSQQVHLDFTVADIEQAHAQVLEIGAQHLKSDDEDHYRVYADPVGHTFCLCW